MFLRHSTVFTLAICYLLQRGIGLVSKSTGLGVAVNEIQHILKADLIPSQESTNPPQDSFLPLNSEIGGVPGAANGKSFYGTEKSCEIH